MRVVTSTLAGATSMTTSSAPAKKAMALVMKLVRSKLATSPAHVKVLVTTVL